MATPTTPSAWLERLTKKLDARLPRINRLRSYTNGNAPLPEMDDATREAWRKFQKRARLNLGQRIAAALSDRMVLNGVVVGEAESATASVASKVFGDTNFDVVVSDAILDAFEVSVAYLLVTEDDNQQPVVTAEKAEDMYAVADPLRPWLAKVAVKTWRDEDDDSDHAVVWFEGTRTAFRRDTVSEGGTTHNRNYSEDWEQDGEATSYDGEVPVYIIENRNGLGEFEPHTDVIDRIHYGILTRLVIMAAQAFRQRAIKGDLPDTDEDGNEYDWSAVFTPAPGALWELPEGIDIWESQITDLQPLLMGQKDDLRDLSGVTATPIAALVPDGANQTAEGAAFQKESIVFKANDRIRRFNPALRAAWLRVMAILGVEEVTVRFQWQPTDQISATERYAAAKMAKDSGEPWTSIARNILGYTDAQVRQAIRDKAAEASQAALLQPPIPVQQIGPGTNDPTDDQEQ